MTLTISYWPYSRSSGAKALLLGQADAVDGQGVAKCTSFVLAHPDDEIAFAPLLSRLVAEQESVRLIYLTDGAAAGPYASVRASESRAAIAHLGIAPDCAFFPGEDGSLPDGQLYLHLDRALDALEDWSRPWRSISGVYSFAWEGGHPDHDAALLVAAAFAARRNLVDHIWQAGFYRASDRFPPPLFTFRSILPQNGEAKAVALSARERRLPLALLRFYRSQWRTFVGLWPLIFWSSFAKPNFELQSLDPRRLFERPTLRPLLYEYRNGLAFEEFAAAVAPFLKAHLKDSDRAPIERKRVGNA